jgi:hypothetical protein
MRRGVGSVSVDGHVQSARTGRDRSKFSNQIQASQDRELIARFFTDLRRALRLTLPQAAQYMRVHPEIIEALETGQVEYLPSWPQTAQIIMAYTSVANIDGRPVLTAVGGLLIALQQAPEPPPVQPQDSYAAQAGYVTQAGGHFVRAGSVIANGARRLPKDAMHQIRERPQRALYALSLPLFILLFFHASIFDGITRPFSVAVNYASAYFQEHFAPVRDGFHWIEVSDPRSRRADKLQIASGSY